MMENKKFKFTANAKELENCIKRAASVMALSTNPAYFIGVVKKRLCVIALGANAFVTVAVPGAKVEGDGGFGFKYEILPGLIKGRADMNFEFNGRELSYAVAKGKYSGSIPTEPVTTDQQTQIAKNAASEKENDASVLPKDVIARLKAGLQATNIKDVYHGTTLLSYISLDKKGMLKVSSFSAQHFALLTLQMKHKGSEFRAGIPASHFSLIDAIAGDGEVKFYIGSSNIRVEGKGFIVVLPSTQAEDRHYGMVENFMGALDKCEAEFTYANADMLSIADNLFSLYNVNTTFSLVAKEAATTLNINFTTTSGTASDALKIKPSKKSKAFKVGVDPRLLRDILYLAKNVKDPAMAIYNKVVSVQGQVGDANLFLACARAE